MRLFAALPLAPAAIERLSSLRLRLSNPGDGLRWSSPEQWHITLQFYGDLPAESASSLHAALNASSLPQAEVALDRLDLFESKGILYTSVLPAPSLEALYAAVLQAGKACGIAPASRLYQPHITLARSKGKSGAATLRRLRQPDLPSFGPEIAWVATECVLLESTLRPHGAQYNTYARVPLPPMVS